MDFCYFERDIEVFSDEEGVYKNINGYCVGDMSRGMKAETKQDARLKYGTGPTTIEAIRKPELISPNVCVLGPLRVMENPVSCRPDEEEELCLDEQEFVHAEYKPYLGSHLLDIDNQNLVWENGIQKRKYFLPRPLNVVSGEKLSFTLTPEQEK